ncbi:ATP-binding protein [Crenobacter sp. SG2303]|uniref:histidine kinase n=1 Tax=Crenobacter oryzisoli TaxID=3056844 RepID=A0ABT7XSW8_9NEIS|nr:ATP-binding protein [Crenobacter sp. SG2303]MDN0076879.1 ATP-binding protein [Crenobacter sp. SG2303]
MTRSRRRQLRIFLTVLLSLLLVTAAGIGAFRASVSDALDVMQRRAGQRLDLYSTSLESEIARYAQLPGILGLAQPVDALIHDPNNPQRQQEANRYLERLAERTGASAIYIQDWLGEVVATSNWQRSDSYLGENDAYRPYFQDAAAGGAGRFFGVGTSRSEPGYYLSDGLYDGPRLLGVAVVKISLARVEKAWAESKSLVLVTDQNGVVILSSEPRWKFTAAEPLDAAVRAEFDRTRQYNRLPLPPLGLKTLRRLDSDVQVVLLPKASTSLPSSDPYPRHFLAKSRALAQSDWRVTELLSLDAVYELAYSRAALAGVLTALAIVALLWWSERRRHVRDKLAAREALQRAYNELERKVEDRTADLSSTNLRLQAEVAERARAEQHLRQTQDELVQAGKLAVIGQLSTGVAHELNQPLAAVRTLSGNAIRFLERGDLATASANLSTINELVEKMGSITSALRSFARKSTSSVGVTQLQRAIDNALFLVDQRLKKTRTQVLRPTMPETLAVRCDPNRFEQVLVNLLTNALDELENYPAPRIEITCRRDGAQVVLSVRDNGPGLADSVRAHLFEPFFTTKPAGIGLGLGLTLSAGIVAEAGGALMGDNHPEGGAQFTLTLPAVSEEEQHD